MGSGASPLPCRSGSEGSLCFRALLISADGEVVLEGPERQDDADDEARRGDQKQPESLVDSP